MTELYFQTNKKLRQSKSSKIYGPTTSSRWHQQIIANNVQLTNVARKSFEESWLSPLLDLG